MRHVTLTLAAMLGLMCSDARAGLQLNFANVTNAVVQFTGNGSGATIAFVDGFGARDFQITTSTSGSASAVGLQGNISGTFSYTVPMSGNTAALITNGPLPNFSIYDGTTTLNADLIGVDIGQFGGVGGFNINTSINLSNIIYTGTNADLVQLRDEANLNGGVATISYQFATSMSLESLATNNLVTTNSYSGTIATTSNVVPEPSNLAMIALALPMMGLGYYRLRRRSRS